MKDLLGERFGKLTVIGSPHKKGGGNKYYIKCRCDCGNTKDIVVDNLISGNTSSCGCSRVKDLTGQRFGQLVVKSFSHTDSRGAWWLCECDCGNLKVVRNSSLRCGDSKTCGHVESLIGQRFGRLVVVGEDTRPREEKAKRIRWLCVCDCGGYTSVTSTNLKFGNTTSCGCYKKVVSVTHGMTNTPTYKVWDALVQRCTNPNSAAYHHYGGRGITVCERWLKFENFLEDMGPRPEGLEIDRIDNAKGYYKENCRWTTRLVNARNTRGSRFITFNEETHCLSEWAEKMGLSIPTLQGRLAAGWPIEEALTTPPKTKLNRSKKTEEK